MKKIFKGLFVLLFIFLFSACTKDYKPITYTKFIETFKVEDEYLVNNATSILDGKFERFIEASGKNNQFIFYEFKTEKEAKAYVKLNFKDQKGFSYKDKSKYIEVTNTKGLYFRLIQVDKVVIIGSSDIKSNKREINRIFKQLGY